MSEFTDKLLRDIADLKRQVTDLQEKVKILSSVQIEGHGKITVSGGELKINNSNSTKEISNRLDVIETLLDI